MTIAVVLGNRNNDDGTLSDIALQRMDITLQLLQHTAIDSILLSGGIANKVCNVSESHLMQQYLIAHGVSASRILLEDHSLTTQQNAQYCAPIINNMTADTVWLITSAQHMHRAYLNPLKLFAKYLDSNITLIPYTGGTP